MVKKPARFLPENERCAVCNAGLEELYICDWCKSKVCAECITPVSSTMAVCFRCKQQIEDWKKAVRKEEKE